MKNINLTEKENNEVNTLIRLGDSEELAVQTVINNRSRNTDNSVYFQAYCI